MKIGILGGSFNPPHNIHLKVAKDLLNEKIVDQVIFIPNIKNPYHNKKLIEPRHRLEMIKLMIDKQPNMSFSDLELKKDHQNYSYQTLDELKDLYPKDQIMLIIGSDNLKEINKWGQYEYLLSTYQVIIIKRDNDDIRQIIKDNKLTKYQNNLIIFDNNITSSLSSTFLRKLLLENQKIKKYINKKVYEYIIKNDLYS